jgi:hypothetical protein
VQTFSNSQVVTVKTNDDSPLGLTTGYIPGFDIASPNITAPSANKLYNYFTMMVAMVQVVVGTVTSASDSSPQMLTAGRAVDITPAPFPDIFGTRLSSSPDLWSFASTTLSAQVKDSLFASAGEGPPLAQQLEELFMNMTVAMLSSPTTSSNATAEVFRWSSVITYEYAAWHLWLTYGVGLLVAVLIVSLGFAAMFVNGATYSTKSSTYLRTAPLSTIDEILVEDKDTGADPLPQDVARGMVMLRSGSAIAGTEMTGVEDVFDKSLLKRRTL